MIPEFLTLSYKLYKPWAWSLSAPWVDEPACVVCGHQPTHCEGTGHASVEGGNMWSDIIGSGSSGPRFMVSERVVESLRQAVAGSFEAFPVEIQKVSSKTLAKRSPVRYFYLCAYDGLLLDLEAGGVPPSKVCLACHGLTEHVRVRRYVPIRESWNGSDLFGCNNGPQGICCTQKVLQLAREERWTNFRFAPIDADQRHLSGWDGIDYLGKQWPPAQWYPPAPSAGKSLEQWIEQMGSDDYVEVARASDALRDLEADAVPGLIRFMERGREPFHRFWAARALVLLPHEGVQIPPDVIDAAEQITFANANESNPHQFFRDESGRLRRKV